MINCLWHVFGVDVGCSNVVVYYCCRSFANLSIFYLFVFIFVCKLFDLILFYLLIRVHVCRFVRPLVDLLKQHNTGS